MNTALILSVYGWLGLVISFAALLVMWVAAGCVGALLFRRMTRIYHISVIFYWLSRLEKEGVRCFRKTLEERDPKGGAQ